MSVGEYCIRDIVVVDEKAPIELAVELMRSNHVGALVVVNQNKPVGIVTDRDIVVEVLAEKVDIHSLNVSDIMGLDILVLNQDIDLMSAIKMLRDMGVRRAPVVGNNEELIGIISVDDILDLLAEQMMDLAKLISKEQRKERIKTI